MIVATLQSICSDDNFDLFWKRISEMAGEKEIDEHVPPRRRKLPRRYNGSHEGDFPDTIEDHYKRLNLVIICGIKKRFDQPGYKVYSQLKLLVKGAKGEQYEEELKFVTDFYKEDFNTSQLDLQLRIMSSNITSESSKDLMSIIGHLHDLSLL